MLSKLCKGLKRADSQYLKNRALEIMCVYKIWSDLKGEYYVLIDLKGEKDSLFI